MIIAKTSEGEEGQDDAGEGSEFKSCRVLMVLLWFRRNEVRTSFRDIALTLLREYVCWWGARVDYRGPMRELLQWLWQNSDGLPRMKAGSMESRDFGDRGDQTDCTRGRRRTVLGRPLRLKQEVFYGREKMNSDFLSFLGFLFTLIIFYCLCYYSYPDFSPFAPLHPAAPLSQAIPTLLFMSMGHVYKFFGCSISYAILYNPWLFSNYLFVLFNSLTSSTHSSQPLYHLATIKIFSIFIILSPFLFG